MGATPSKSTRSRSIGHVGKAPKPILPSIYEDEVDELTEEKKDEIFAA